MSNKEARLHNFLSEMPDFVFSYIAEAYTGDSINTQLGYSMDIKTFLEFLKKFKFPEVESIEDFTCAHMEQVTTRDFISYKAYLKEYEDTAVGIDGREIRTVRKNSAYGINRKLSAVSGLYKYMYKTDMISQNITDKVDYTKLHQKIKKPLTTQEVVRLVDVIFNGEGYYEGRKLSEYLRNKKRDIAIFTAYLGTGVRVSELMNLNINDIIFDTSSMIVTRKGGNQEEVFMPVQVENSLLEYLEERTERKDAPDKDAVFISRRGTRMTIAAVENMLKNYCHTAGIYDPDKTRPHALRRTFACRLLEDGVDIKMVAELMGHKNIEVTHRYYAQYSSKARREVMRNLKVVETENDNE